MANTYNVAGKWIHDLVSDFVGSDRACAVLAGAVLDDKLKSLLLGYLLPPSNRKDDRLLGRNGSINSFSARIQLAHRLGLVSEEVREALDWLRDVRNDAAHQQDFHFDQNENKDRIKNIADTLRTQQRLPAKLLAEYGATAKGSFVASVSLLVLVLELEIGESGQTRQKPYNLLNRTLEWKDEG